MDIFLDGRKVRAPNIQSFSDVSGVLL